MAISISTDKTDETGKEILNYGTTDFPIAFFNDDLGKVKVPWHWHDEAEIIVILKGEVIVRFHDREYLLQKGEGYFANCGVLHSAELRSESGWQHAMVFDPRLIAGTTALIEKTYLTPLIGNEELPFVILKNNNYWQQEIVRLAEDAWNTGAYETTDYALEVPYALGKICSLILNHYSEAHDEVSDLKKLKKDEIRMKRILNYIGKHYAENIGIDDIAGSCSISVSTLLRLCRNSLHSTPIQYLLNYRLEEIRKRLLHGPQTTISEIAYSCGFNDISYFNRCFLHKYGVTPSFYRSENRH